MTKKNVIHTLENLKKDEEAKEDDDDELQYDRILSNIGFGKFHLGLLLVCGWANASDAVEVLSISFVLPSAQCDLDLDGPKKGWLSALTFVGMMFGGYIWGALSDSRGRKPALIMALVVNAVGGVLSALMPSYALFLAARFLSGMGVGGSIPVVWSYFAEYLPAKNRGRMMSLMATSWLCGNLLVAGLAWIIVPMKSIQLPISSILTLDSWRVFVLVSAFPAFSAALMLLCFPESPKFCLRKGQRQRAYEILSAITPKSQQKKQLSEARIFQDLTTTHETTPLVSDFASSSPCCCCCPTAYSSCLRQCSSLASKTAALFRPPNLRNNLVMILIFFSICFGYYGLFMWFPELFDRSAKTGLAPCAVAAHANSSILHDNGTSLCYPPTEVFVNSFLTTASSIPGFLFAVAFMDKLGRKACLIISMVTSGMVVFGIWAAQTSTDALILSCVFGGFSNIGFSAFNCMAVELFPTELRATATGIQLGMGRVAAILGNVVFGEMLGVNCAVPILLVAGLMVFGGFISLLLPNTTNSVLR